MQDTLASVADITEVRASFRLGWAVAEVRGRARLGPEDPGAPQRPDLDRRGHALPLALERSSIEQAIEAREVLASLARQLKVDVPLRELTGQGRGTSHASSRLHGLLNRPRLSQGQWAVFSEFMWAWDARIQDVLAAGSFGRSSAYQLGRGLAEVSWALDTDAPVNSVGSWQFLLGERRVELLSGILDRLARYFHPLTSPAIKGSLGAWRDAAGRAAVRHDPESVRVLRRQVRLWRDLILIAGDPRTLIRFRDGIITARRFRVGWRLAMALWPQLAIGALSIGGLVGAALLISDSNSGGAVAAIVSAVGLTGSTLTAKAKSSAQLLFEQAKAGYSEQLAIDAATILPEATAG